MNDQQALAFAGNQSRFRWPRCILLKREQTVSARGRTVVQTLFYATDKGVIIEDVTVACPRPLIRQDVR